MNLWNDTFKIEIRKSSDNRHEDDVEFQEYFTGSLKGAIRYFISKYSKEKGHYVGSFYNSKNGWLKEIGW